MRSRRICRERGFVREREYFADKEASDCGEMLTMIWVGASASFVPFFAIALRNSSTDCIPIRTDSALVTHPLQAKQSLRLISAVSNFVRALGLLSSIEEERFKLD